MEPVKGPKRRLMIKFSAPDLVIPCAMIKEPRIIKTESDAYEEKAESLSSPKRTKATPAISAVTGSGKVSDTHK